MPETTIKFQIYLRFDDENPTTPPHLLTETIDLDDINDLIKTLYRNGALEFLKEIIIKIVEAEEGT